MAPEQPPIRWGIASTGKVAQDFARDLTLVPDARAVAVASRTRERAEAFGDQHGIPVRHGSYEALAADPDIDIVYVASPHSHHAEHTLLFLEGGKHVLCEKPFAINHREATEMVALARHKRLFLMEAMWCRFLPAYVALRRLLDDGAVGEPLMLEASLGFRMPFNAAHRLFDRALGGGALLDLGIYPVQLSSLVFGPSVRSTASAHIGETGVDERVTAVLDHPGGATSVIQAATRANLRCDASISGTDGIIRLPALMHCPDRLVLTRDHKREEIPAPYSGNGLRFQVGEVHRCLREQRLESRVMPLDETCGLAATLDAIRAAVGLRYPADD